CTHMVACPVRWWKKPEHSVLTWNKKAAGDMRHKMARISGCFFSRLYFYLIYRGGINSKNT
ncbi:hypothetical protein, partial [Escherichia coli]|uniref:hypothetical protein n=1 Tax=Escherichia coli TaxID=562 RepID=UPI001BC8A725